MSIGEVAELLNVTSSTLRRWEKEGKLVPTIRTAGSHRKYQIDEVRCFLENSIKEKQNRFVKENKENVLRAINQLADGIVTLHDRQLKDGIKHLPKNWHDATSFLFHYSNQSKSEVVFPTDLTNQLAFFKKPLKEWKIKGFDQWFSEEEELVEMQPLLLNGNDVEYARILQENFINTEVTTPFVEFMEFCRTNKKQELYTHVRTLLIQNPIYHKVLGNFLMREVGNLQEEAKIFFSIFYEKIPAYKVIDDQLTLCPYCGSPLSHQQNRYECEFYKCRYYCEKGNFNKWGKFVQIDYKEQLQLKKEVLHAITIPGISELRIYDALKKEQKVSNVELFPECDLGDIALKKNNEHWLIDVKDYLNAHDLLRELNTKPNYRFARKQYAQQIIVVPKFHSKKYVQYIERRLESGVNYTILHEYDLLKKVREA